MSRWQKLFYNSHSLAVIPLAAWMWLSLKGWIW
jgi:hypothetical protein